MRAVASNANRMISSLRLRLLALSTAISGLVLAPLEGVG
jgi:hypothetical protein